MAKHPTKKTKKQVGLLLSKKSPLSGGQKSNLKKEVKSGIVKIKKMKGK